MQLCVILAHGLINGVLPLHVVYCPSPSFPQNMKEFGRSYAENDTFLIEFPGYWWLFQTQDLSHYSARLAKERR